MKKMIIPIKRQKGLSLIELMVAMSLGLILLLSGAAMYSQLKLKIAAAQATKSLHQKARITLNILARITAMAGNTYCVDRNTLNTSPALRYSPIDFDPNFNWTTQGKVSMLISGTVPLGRGFNYFNSRRNAFGYVPYGTNRYVDEANPGGTESVCGESTTRYYIAPYLIHHGKIGGDNMLTISNFQPAKNVNEHYLLADNVTNFTVELGSADTLDGKFATRYLEKKDILTSDDMNMIRSVKYTITIQNAKNLVEQITLSRVVMLANPWVLE